MGEWVPIVGLSANNSTIVQMQGMFNKRGIKWKKMSD